MSGEQMPADFEAFVSTHARRLRMACAELAGNDRLAASLRLDLLAAVALRWRRWWRPARRRERAGLVHLDRLLRREVRSWHLHPDQPEAPDRLRMVPAGSAQPPRVLLPSADGQDGDDAHALAEAAWEHADRLRRRGRLTIATAAVVIALLAAVGPHAAPVVRPEPPPPEPLPNGVAVLPAYRALDELPSTTKYALPAHVAMDQSSVAALPSLASAPVQRAIALLRNDLGLLVVVGADGSLRRVDDPALAAARLVATSLSPDGRRAALAMGDGLLVIDLDTGAVHALPAGAAQPDPPVLVWRTPSSVVMPGTAGARQVDVVSGAVQTLPGVTGVDVVSTQAGSTQLTELVAASSTAGQAPRIRFWRSEPTAASARDVEDRPIFGPLWIWSWSGPGWSSPAMLARDCGVDTLRLPARFGPARTAVGALLTSGLYRGTLVAVDTTQLDVLGFLEPMVVAVAARSPTVGTTILAWRPGSAVSRVTTADADVRVSLADLLPPP